MRGQYSFHTSWLLQSLPRDTIRPVSGAFLLAGFLIRKASIIPAPLSFSQAPRLRSRLGALVASTVLFLLGVLALLSLGMGGMGKGPEAAHLVSMDMTPKAAGPQAKTVKSVAQAHSAASAQPRTQPETPPEPVPTTPPPPSYIRLSHEDFAASDIAAIGRRRAAQANAEAATEKANAMGPGAGPGGARLYRAQWYREPSDAEMRTYLDRGAPDGSWAIIACQTVANFHVENCQEMEEYPLGSGLARGLRRAAWQFKIWPPRVDGKPQIGTWVSIRFDFGRKGGD